MQVMHEFIVDVEFSTHDALKLGICVLGFRRFRISAENADAATLIAAQWVAADRITSGVIPTATTVCI